MSALEGALHRLQLHGVVTFCPRGNSMMPRIKSGQAVTVVKIEDYSMLSVNDIVLCKVKDKMWLHLVTDINHSKRRAEISNNYGKRTGWTPFEDIYGVMQG